MKCLLQITPVVPIFWRQRTVHQKPKYGMKVITVGESGSTKWRIKRPNKAGRIFNTIQTTHGKILFGRSLSPSPKYTEEYSSIAK